MPGCVDDLELMMSELDDFAIIQEALRVYYIMIEYARTENLLNPRLHPCHPGLIALMYLGKQAIFIPDLVTGEQVVIVAVGQQAPDGLQTLLTDVMLEVFALATILGTGVDDDTLTGVIAHHITIGRKLKSSNLYHHTN